MGHQLQQNILEDPADADGLSIPNLFRELGGYDYDRIYNGCRWVLTQLLHIRYASTQMRKLTLLQLVVLSECYLSETRQEQWGSLIASLVCVILQAGGDPRR